MIIRRLRPAFTSYMAAGNQPSSNFGRHSQNRSQQQCRNRIGADAFLNNRVWSSGATRRLFKPESDPLDAASFAQI